MSTIPKPSALATARNAKDTKQYLGRITHRDPISETKSYVTGSMTLITGSTIPWRAPSSLVELHVESFNHPQMVAAGLILKSDGVLRIKAVRPALSEEWAAAIASLIAERYDLPTDDPQTEKLRTEKIAQLVLSMAVPLGMTPARARRKAVKRMQKDEKRAEKAEAAA